MPQAAKIAGTLCVLGGIAWFFLRSPSPTSIVQATDISDTQMLYQGVRFDTQWQDNTIHQGDVQQIVSEYNSYAPMNTHHLVLTTGDYSDPEKVKIQPLRKGHTSWRFKSHPQGSLKVLHLIPKNLKALAALERIEVGQTLSFVGQEEEDNRIPNSGGGYFSGGSKSSGHYLFLLHSVQNPETE